jgi:hypothetical protein
MPASRWAVGRIEAKAVIAGTEYPLTGLQLDFELNGIPRAMIGIPVGRDDRTQTPSPIHSQLNSLTTQLEASVYLRFTPGDASEPLPDLLPTGGWFRAFNGFTGGGVFSLGRGGGTFILSLNHWMIRLTDGNVMSRVSHPVNPSFFTFGALHESGDAGARSLASGTRSDSFITPTNIEDDFWGAALYPWFQALAEEDPFIMQDQGFEGGNIDGGRTAAGLQAALKRLGPTGPPYKPLRFAFRDAIDDHVADAIEEDVANTTADMTVLAHMTLWDLLAARLGPEFGFAVIPTIERGIVAPYVPALRVGENGWKTITVDQENNVRPQFASPRPLRAFGVLTGLATRTGADMNDDDAPPDMGVGGMFDSGIPGSILMLQGPAWSGQLMSPSRMSAAASGANATAIGTALDPGTGKQNGERNQAGGRAAALKGALDRYAHARYVETVLRERSFTISGPLRFDIAPGSAVQVLGLAERFIANDVTAQPLFGTVLRCSISVDAEAQTCATSYHVGYHRNTAENNSGLFATPAHPLYDSAFQGCSLLA